MELSKAFLKLKEYRALVKYEEINVMIELDLYKQYKESQAYEQGLIKLIRSSRTINKPTDPIVSTGL